jgi:hypothetical protein
MGGIHGSIHCGQTHVIRVPGKRARVREFRQRRPSPVREGQCLTTDGWLVCCWSPRSARVRQTLRQAARRPGSRPAVEPDSSGRELGLTSNNARESRRRSRQNVVCTTAEPASQAETLGEVHSPGRQHGGGMSR